MSSVSLNVALSVYGKYAAKAAGKDASDLTVEELIHGIMVGRADLNRGIAETVDRITCYRSTHNGEANFRLCSGSADEEATYTSPYCDEVRLVYAHGKCTADIPQYLRDALRTAIRDGQQPAEARVKATSSSANLTSPGSAISVSPAVTLRWMLMPYRRYWEYYGRSSRAEYWSWVLFQALVLSAALGLSTLGGVSFSESEFGAMATQFGWAAVAGTAIWTFAYMANAAALMMIVPAQAAGVQPTPELPTILAIAAVGLFGLASFVPHWNVTVRRLHDTDRSGWWFLAPLAVLWLTGLLLALPFAGVAGAEGVGVVGLDALIPTLAAFVALAVFLSREGNRGTNRFGKLAPEPIAVAGLSREEPELPAIDRLVGKLNHLIASGPPPENITSILIPNAYYKAQRLMTQLRDKGYPHLGNHRLSRGAELVYRYFTYSAFGNYFDETEAELIAEAAVNHREVMWYFVSDSVYPLTDPARQSVLQQYLSNLSSAREFLERRKRSGATA